MPLSLIVMFAVFFFLVGACVGSFLNVVIWRLPNRGLEVSYLNKKGRMTLSWPPSHCPMCDAPIHWYQNMPVLSYLFLRGKCANCRAAIPIRYPLVELGTAFLWLGIYLAYYIAKMQEHTYPWQGAGGGITDFRTDWAPMVFHAVFASALLAASAIDADLFIIPLSVTVMLAILGLVCCVIIGPPFFNSFAIIPSLSPGTLWLGKPILGATFGLILSNVLLMLKILPHSFPWELEGGEAPNGMTDEPSETKKESAGEQASSSKAEEHGALPPPPKLTKYGLSVFASIFLLALLGVLWETVSPKAAALAGIVVAILIFLIGVLPRDAGQIDATDDVIEEISMGNIRLEISKEVLFLAIPIACGYLAYLIPADLPAWPWLLRLLGSLLGLLTGGGVVWLIRIGGSLAFNKQAMGLGDVHLMAGVGAVIGAPLVIIAFFMAAFIAILWAIVIKIMGKPNVLPYGPWLSVASILTLLVGNPLLAAYLRMIP